MDFEAALKQLQLEYLCCKPVQKINWSILRSITWDQQTQLIAHTLNAPVTQLRGNLSQSYRFSVIRHIIRTLESNSLEVHDFFYEYFTELLRTSGSAGQGYAWKHFELWPCGIADTVSIRQSQTIISDGTTGLHSWQAAGALAEWCWVNRDRLAGKNVLELGSGTGLTGVVVAKTCSPARIVLTDGNEKVLALLRENVSENCGTSDRVSVCSLDWDEVDPVDALDGLRPDIILAADVVYDDTLFGPLCRAIEGAFRRSGSDECRLYLACTVRNEATLNTFLGQLDTMGFGRTEESLVAPTVLYWNDSTPIRIFCVAPRRQEQNI